MKNFWRYNRLYIFPNKYGGLGFCLFLVILAAGATYQNNLIFMMAFLLLSLGLVAILQTARNLRDIEVVATTVEPYFPGQETTVWISLKNTAAAPKINLELLLKADSFQCRQSLDYMAAQSTRTIAIKTLLPRQRGVYHFHSLQFKTTYPYGLFTSWIFLKVSGELIVYPAPLGYRQFPNQSAQHGEDYSGHKNYEPSDSLRRIDWKVFSRRNQLLVKEFRDGSSTQVTLDWAETPGADIESKLSQLGLWITLARERDYEFKLKLPNDETLAARGLFHYQSCMEKLARYK